MKRVVSVSLGTSKRDKRAEIEFLGERVSLERRGTDGDLARFAATFSELDGKIDAFGVGGADLVVVVGSRRYPFHQIVRLTRGARVTPVVDGSALKHTLERETVRRLDRDGTFPMKGRRVLLVSAVDRFGMAQALEEAGAIVTYGDLAFGMGINLPLRRYAQVERFGRVILPIVTRLPQQWFYPTGEKQESRTPKFARLFDEAELVCGDWHYIRRYMPDRLDRKTILTQTLREADLQMLKEAGVRRAITTTPSIEGETFATNVIEAALVAILGTRDETAYMPALERHGWAPNVIDLAAPGILA